MVRTLVDNANRITRLFGIIYDKEEQTQKSLAAFISALDSAATTLTTSVKPVVEQAQADLEKYFPAGIQMLFQQSAAPSGWKKLTDHTDCALRLTSEGTGSRTDGLAFSACFASGRGLSTTQISMGVNASTLSVGQLASHSHDVKIGTVGNYPSSPQNLLSAGSGTGNATGWRGSNESHGHGCWNTAHGHSVDFHVNFVDVILCEKE